MYFILSANAELLYILPNMTEIQTFYQSLKL